MMPALVYGKKTIFLFIIMNVDYGLKIKFM